MMKVNLQQLQTSPVRVRGHSQHVRHLSAGRNVKHFLFRAHDLWGGFLGPAHLPKQTFNHFEYLMACTYVELLFKAHHVDLTLTH